MVVSGVISACMERGAGEGVGHTWEFRLLCKYKSVIIAHLYLNVSENNRCCGYKNSLRILNEGSERSRKTLTQQSAAILYCACSDVLMLFGN